MHLRHSTPQLTLPFLFLFGLLLCCHRHLLLGFPGVGLYSREGNSLLRRRDSYPSKTLPHLVSSWIIMAQGIVCQEKNVIL